MFKKILAILIILITLVGCSEKKEEEIIFVTADQPIEVEYGEEIDLLSSNIILEANGEIVAKDNLDIHKPGMQEITYIVSYKENKQEVKVSFFVKNPVDAFEVYKDLLPPGKYYKCGEYGETYYGIAGDTILYSLSAYSKEKGPYEYLQNNKAFDNQVGTPLSLQEGTTKIYRPDGDGDLSLIAVLDDGIYTLDLSKNYLLKETQRLFQAVVRLK